MPYLEWQTFIHYVCSTNHPILDEACRQVPQGHPHAEHQSGLSQKARLHISSAVSRWQNNSRFMFTQNIRIIRLADYFFQRKYSRKKKGSRRKILKPILCRDFRAGRMDLVIFHTLFNSFSWFGWSETIENNSFLFLSASLVEGEYDVSSLKIKNKAGST